MFKMIADPKISVSNGKFTFLGLELFKLFLSEGVWVTHYAEVFLYFKNLEFWQQTKFPFEISH